MAKTEIKVAFKLARPKEKTTSIKAYLYDNAFRTEKDIDSNRGGRLVIGTGERVSPKHWSLKRQRCNDIKGVDTKPIYENTNLQLDRFEAESIKVFAELNEQGREINKDDFKKLLKIKLKTAPATKETNTLDIFGYIKDRLDNNYPIRIGNEIKNLKPRTITNKKQVLTKLEDYRDWKPKASEKVKKVLVSFETMNEDFYNSFIYYLKEVLEHKTNTRGKIIKNLKNFLRYAQNDGYKVNSEYKQFLCEVGDPKEVTYLDESELIAIRSLDLTKSPHLDRARDLFVFASYTGFRYGDLYSFQEHWVNKRTGVITYKQEKVEHSVTVPLSTIVLDILKKYDNKLPRLSNQKANKHIKEVCELAKIDKVIRIEMRVNKETGKEESVTIYKWQTVTTHDARRSFCSNLYHNKIPSYKIMKLSGHKTEASFLRYIGIDEEVNALEIGQIDYFNTTLKVAK